MKGTEPYPVVDGLMKHYGDGEARVQVLDGITTEVMRGEVCVMLGPSGSGKSTFLNLIGGLEGADGGTVSVGGCELTALGSRELGEYRRRELGFVFQFYNLVPDLTIRENIEVTAHLSDKPLPMEDLLHSLGLWEHRDKFPRQVSGGQQQRCSIKRVSLSEALKVQEWGWREARPRRGRSGWAVPALLWPYTSGSRRRGGA